MKTLWKSPIDSIPSNFVGLEFSLAPTNLKKGTLGISSCPICKSSSGTDVYRCCAPSDRRQTMRCFVEIPAAGVQMC